MYKGLLYLLFAFTLILYFFAPVRFNQAYMSCIFIILVLSLFLFGRLLKQRWGKVNWISPSILFLFSFIIVHFQMYFYSIFAFDIKMSVLNFIWADEKIICKAACISLLGVLGFMLGYFIIFKMPEKQHKKKNVLLENIATLSGNSKYLIIIYTITIVSYLAFFSTASFYRRGIYSPYQESAISGYFFFLFNLLLTSSIIHKLLYINSLDISRITLFGYVKKIGYPIALITAWHMLYSFYVGDRGPVISYGLLIMGYYFFKWKRVKLGYILVFILVGGTLFSIVGKARRLASTTSNSSFTQRISTTVSEGTLSNRFESESVPLEQTVELAMSVRCLNHAVANIPEKYDYNLGFFQLKQLVSVIPGGSSTFLKLTNKNLRYDGSTSFITFLIQGDHSTYGDGTTVAADLYLDFGMFGVILGMFLFGLFIRKGEIALNTKTSSVFLWCCISIYFAFSIYIGRSSLLFNLKAATMVYFIIIGNYFLYKLLTNGNKKTDIIHSN